MAKMTPDEIHAFLLAGSRTAKIATVREDGRPHVAPVWFVLDGDDIIFTTGATSVKGKSLHHNPQVAISVDEENLPFGFVIIEGTAVLSEDVEQLRQWAIRIAARYMGADKAEAFGARNGVPGEYLVRVTPTKTLAQKDVVS